MPKNMKVFRNYNRNQAQLARLVGEAMNACGFESPAAALHALFEVAAQKAKSEGFGYENYVRSALCAYDCFHERGALEAVNMANPSEVN